jgi:hypothetical protein
MLGLIRPGACRMVRDAHVGLESRTERVDVPA